MPSVRGLYNYTHVLRFIVGHHEICARADVDNTEINLIVICVYNLELGGFLFISIMVIYLSIFY